MAYRVSLFEALHEYYPHLSRLAGMSKSNLAATSLLAVACAKQAKYADTGVDLASVDKYLHSGQEVHSP